MWIGPWGEAMMGFSEGEYPRTTDKDGRFAIRDSIHRYLG